MPRMLTVGIELKDNDESRALMETLRSNMFTESETADYSVFAMSARDEFARLEAIEGVMGELYGDELEEAISNILSSCDPREVSSV